VTFSFSPDGKTLAFVNEAGNDCRIALDKMELTVGKLTGLNPSVGIRFSHDGKRIAFARQDDARYRVCVADPDARNEVVLVDVVVTDAHALGGFDFLPDERIGLVSKTGMRIFDAKTGKEGDATTWKTPLKMRSFGGWSPDGSAFVFDDGGPYLLDLYHFDVKTQKVTLVKNRYLESFQQVVWVRVPVK
jgi:Tol biopolymer transport system component